MIYLILGAFFIYLSYIEIFYRRMQNSKFSFIIILMILFMISSMRYEVGTDWSNYLSFYTNDDSVREGLEVGYRILNNLFSYLELHYNIFLAGISFVTLFFIYQIGISLKYKSIVLFMYFSELFLYYNFSGMRQGIAIAITLYSIKFIINKDFKFFVILVLFASLFHITALSFLIAYFIYHLEVTKINAVLFAFFLLLAALVLNELIDYLLMYTDNKKIQYYFLLAGVQEDNTMHFIVGFIKRSIILIIFIFLPKKEKNRYNLLALIKVYFIGFIIYILFYSISEDVATRVGSYFLIFDLLIISTFFQLHIHVYKKLVIFIVISCMYMYKLYGYSQMIAYQYQTFI